MLNMRLITRREGIEMSPVVAIGGTGLRKRGRSAT